MGLISGRIACRRYVVAGTHLEEPLDELIRRQDFQGFQDEGQKAAGWVSLTDWFMPASKDTFEIQPHLLALTLRQDSKRVPPHLYREECRLKEAEWRHTAGREELTRAEREEVKTIVFRKLLAQALPGTQGVDVVTNGRFAWVLSASEPLNEVVRTLYEKTFGPKLMAMTPEMLLKHEGYRGSDHEGSDFLAWLWYRAEVLGEIDLFIEDKIAFCDPETGRQHFIVKQGDVASTPEAKAARAAGKQITEMRCSINGTFTATIHAYSLDLTAIRLPTVAAEEEDDWRSTALARYGHLVNLWEAIDQWWNDFVKLKTSDEWEKTRVAITQWA